MTEFQTLECTNGQISSSCERFASLLETLLMILLRTDHSKLRWQRRASFYSPRVRGPQQSAHEKRHTKACSGLTPLQISAKMARIAAQPAFYRPRETTGMITRMITRMSPPALTQNSARRRLQLPAQKAPVIVPIAHVHYRSLPLPKMQR